MVLIEASDKKKPDDYTMGIRNDNNNYKCVLFMLENPFYDAVEGKERQNCRDMDGNSFSYF